MRRVKNNETVKGGDNTMTPYQYKFKILTIERLEQMQRAKLVTLAIKQIFQF